MFMFQVIVLAMNFGVAIFAFVSDSMGLGILAGGIAGWLLYDLVKMAHASPEDF